MKPGKVVLLVLGILLLLVAVGVLLGGGAAVVVNTAFTDDEGFLTARDVRIDKQGHAVVSETARLEFDWAWRRRPAAAVRVQASPEGDEPLFIGIGPAAEVSTYLVDVAHQVVTEFSLRLEDIVYRSVEGTRTPEPPGEQRFWSAGVEGRGTQTLLWDAEPGEWMLVLMNAEGSPGIEAVSTLSIRVPWLGRLGVALLVAGAVLLLLGLASVFLAVHQGAPLSGVGAPQRPDASPLTFTGELTEPLSPALWIIKWFLLIPHYVALALLGAGFVVSWLASFFAILFTGRYPRSLFAYNVGVLRWAWRVNFYGMQAYGTDRYPPFSLQSRGYPAELDVAYPEQLSRGLVLVKWWILALPHYLVIALFQGGGGQHSGGGLVPLLALYAGVSLLFTGRYPRGIFEFLMQMNRWTYRVVAYAALMTDQYPPFRLGE